MRYKVLFFGNKSCPYSMGAYDFLKKLNLNVIGVWSEKRNEKIPEEIFSWKGDYIFSFQSYVIVPKEILDNAKICINIHPASPEYPGSGGPAWAIYDEVKYYGCTAHIMNERIDNGAILKVKRFNILPTDTITSLLHRAKLNAIILFYEMAQDLFINKKTIDQFILENNHEKWSGVDRKIYQVNKMRFIDSDIDLVEFEKRVKAFHSVDYPLKLKFHGKNFVLEDNL